MKISEIKKEIKGVFKQPIKKYYFGKITHGCPHFYPSNFVKWIFNIRKLKLRTEQELKEYSERFSHLKNLSTTHKFSNLPMVRKTNNWIFKLFGNYYYIEIGYPFSFTKVNLGWKDKYNTPRHEWNPQYQILFFGLEFHSWWVSLVGDAFDDSYWEHILWYLKYSNKDIKQAEVSWGWVNFENKESTWNKNYLALNYY